MTALGGVDLIGVDAHTGTKLLYTLVFIAALALLRWVARHTVRFALRGRTNHNARFWARQGINLATAVLFGLGIVSIWFDNGLHAAAALGLISAGIAFAMQKAITSLAGYFLILRGDIFSIGDRIVMGGVRGDVIGLGFLRTTILEMGQPDNDKDGSIAVWVDARQYTGRIVTVTNGVVFDEPVYNYSREFAFLWEEIHVGIKFDADRATAEQLMLDAALRHGLDGSAIGQEAMRRMRRRFYVPDTDLKPEVFCSLADSWVDLAVRFIVPTHGIRQIKSAITRDILDGFAAQGIDIAYNTYAIVDVPPLRVDGVVGSAGEAPAYPSSPSSAERSARTSSS